MSATGWAFAVARTPTQGYRLMLAPRPLVERAAQDVVERYARPGGEGSAPTVRTVTHLGGTLVLVCATHRVRGDDGNLLLDEHGRPIDLAYGFACRPPVRAVAQEDLAAALEQALDVYRRALTAAGTAAGPVLSEPFPLRSGVGGVDSSATGEPAGGAPVPRPTGSPAARRRLLAVAAAAVLAAAGTVAGCLAISMRSTLDVPAALVGTWRGPVRSTPAGGGNERAYTVDLPCAARPCSVTRGQRFGGIRDGIGCAYALTADAWEGGALILTVTMRDGTSPPCLPAGTVRIAVGDRPDTVRLDWYPPGDDPPAMATGAALDRA
jgi:hypothetical protein